MYINRYRSPARQTQQPMSQTPRKPSTPEGLRIRLVFDDGSMLGPGKADLLDAIRETGSISAAGRHMCMSYKRAWMLVETMNATFREPLVQSSRGGSAHGGAELTDAGTRVLTLYRGMVAKAAAAAGGEIATLRRMRADASGEK
jgi:molybdate transport system regulatory protein